MRVVMGGARLTDEVIDQVMASAMSRYPDAPITALSPDGWFIAPPAGMDVSGRPVLVAETALSLVPPDERGAVVAAWARVRATGASQVLVHPLDGNGQQSMMLFGDLRHRHGTFVMLMVPGEDTLDVDGVTAAASLTPRYCQLRRNELAYVVEADAASARMFGWPVESMVGRKSLELIHPEDHDRAIDNWLEMLGGPGRACRWRGRYLKADGTWTWVEITNHNRLDDPHHHDVLTEMVTIDEEIAMHEELRAREELIRELTQALPVGVLQATVDGTVVFTNDRLCEIVDLAAVPTLEAWRGVMDPAGHAAFDQAIEAVSDGEASRSLEVHLLRRGGTTTVCQVMLRPLHRGDGSVRGIIACVTDVTESVRLRDELQVRATYDALTSCHNRASTLRQLEALLAAPAAGGVGVVFIDLDDFKPVNDQHGHSVGDELLIHVADRLRAWSRANDVVGRIGGDEFVVVCPNVAGMEALEVLAERLRTGVHGEAALGSVSVPVRASVGMALGWPGDDAGSILAAADAEMYAAKRARAKARSPRSNASRKAS